ncbi:hypothetical protein Aab01nite_67370 [Paractinoplanes abujensis]|uniref:histidine kinase n=1 Tax=Paractinoplanes abujensis TaxID=882441 RepID=A0A7W7CVT5_9ACTN|nr:HAMP domain-containing protein [Actinoplanes abujensis]MBB4695563.1 HAMP domain-containing protein [Actinoplanes abujensis]GID23147.1 hypothetical protein Aab01nite_67370 [Actinoplanes abujensis]
MRLRTQLTLTVTALVALVVALAGLLIVVRIDHRDRDDLDRVLAARAEQVRAAAQKNGSLPTDGSFAIRLIQGGEMLKQVGSSAGFPMPAKDGYSTVSSGDDEWRSLAQTLPTGGQLQILMSLDDLSEQHTDNVLVVDLLVLLAAVLSAAGVWFATGLVLRPFQRLLGAARELDPADPGQRLPEVKSPREVAELTDALNDLLSRVRSSSPATPAAASFAGTDSTTTSEAAAAPTVEIRALKPRHASDESPTHPGDESATRPAQSTPGTAPARHDSATAPAPADTAATPASTGSATAPGSDFAPASASTGSATAPAPTDPAAAPAPTDPAGAPAPTGSAAALGPADPPAASASTGPATGPAPADPATVLVPGASTAAPAHAAPEAVPTGSPAPAFAAISPAVAELRPSLVDMGAQLDQLLDNPEMPATQRHLILALMADEHRRMTALIDGDA